MEYIIDTFSAKALLPSDTAGKARALALAQYVVSEIQPLQNTRLDAYMEEEVSMSHLILLPTAATSDGACTSARHIEHGGKVTRLYEASSRN